MIKSDDLAKIRDCELTITFEHDMMKAYNDVEEVTTEDAIIESLAFSDNSLNFKFIQNIHHHYFQKHIDTIHKDSKIF